MESLNQSLDQVQREIEESDTKLKSIQSEATVSKTNSVSQIRLSLSNGSRRLQNVATEIRTLLLSIGMVEKPSATSLVDTRSLDLSRQTTWVSDHLTLSAADFRDAGTHAEVAMTNSMQFRYQASEVAHIVGGKKIWLGNALNESQQMVSDAKSSLEATRQAIREKQSESAAKQQELIDQTLRQNQLSTQRSRLESEVALTRGRLRQAESEVEPSKAAIGEGAVRTFKSAVSGFQRHSLTSLI